MTTLKSEPVAVQSAPPLRHARTVANAAHESQLALAPKPEPETGPEEDAGHVDEDLEELAERKDALIAALEKEVERLTEPVAHELPERIAFLERLLVGVQNGAPLQLHMPRLHELQLEATRAKYVGHISRHQGRDVHPFDGRGKATGAPDFNAVQPSQPQMHYIARPTVMQPAYQWLQYGQHHGHAYASHGPIAY